MERPPSRLPLYLGIVLLTAGWIVIFLGWYQAGQQDLETGQLPYVISGGFGGLGLLLMGVIAILADVIRQAEFKLRGAGDELLRSIQGLADALHSEPSPPPRRLRQTRSALRRDDD